MGIDIGTLLVVIAGTILLFVLLDLLLAGGAMTGGMMAGMMGGVAVGGGGLIVVLLLAFIALLVIWVLLALSKSQDADDRIQRADSPEHGRRERRPGRRTATAVLSAYAYLSDARCDG